MASHDTNSLNLAKLEREVLTAVDNEERYWRENDAKFRAVYQKVATYDEFKDIVAASNLRPLDKGEKLEFTASQPWNQIAATQSAGTTVHSPNDQPTEQKTPKNSNEFVKEWRKLKDDWTRYDFLKTIGPQKIGEILITEIPFGILGDILSTLVNLDSMEIDDFAMIFDLDFTMVLDLLRELSKAKRFDLSVQFFSKVEQKNCNLLFDKLYKLSNDSDDSKTKLDELSILYGVRL